MKKIKLDTESIVTDVNGRLGIGQMLPIFSNAWPMQFFIRTKTMNIRSSQFSPPHLHLAILGHSVIPFKEQMMHI